MEHELLHSDRGDFDLRLSNQVKKDREKMESGERKKWNFRKTSASETSTNTGPLPTFGLIYQSSDSRNKRAVSPTMTFDNALSDHDEPIDTKPKSPSPSRNLSQSANAQARVSSKTPIDIQKSSKITRARLQSTPISRTIPPVINRPQSAIKIGERMYRQVSVPVFQQPSLSSSPPTQERQDLATPVDDQHTSQQWKQPVQQQFYTTDTLSNVIEKLEENQPRIKTRSHSDKGTLGVKTVDDNSNTMWKGNQETGNWTEFLSPSNEVFVPNDEAWAGTDNVVADVDDGGVVTPGNVSHSSRSSNSSESEDAEESVWRITEEQRAYYLNQFRILQPAEKGIVAGQKAKDFFLKSGLGMDVLSRIWNLADLDNDGGLNFDEFCIAMHVVVAVRHGLEVPNTLPPYLIPDKYETQGITPPMTESNGNELSAQDSSQAWAQFPPNPLNQMSETETRTVQSVGSTVHPAIENIPAVSQQAQSHAFQQAGQHAQHAVQHVQAIPQHGQPVPQHGQPVPQHGQAVPQHGQPVPQHVQPIPQHVQPIPQHVQPIPQHGQPVPQHGQPVPQHVQPIPQQGQPVPRHGHSQPTQQLRQHAQVGAENPQKQAAQHVEPVAEHDPTVTQPLQQQTTPLQQTAATHLQQVASQQPATVSHHTQSSRRVQRTMSDPNSLEENNAAASRKISVGIPRVRGQPRQTNLLDTPHWAILPPPSKFAKDNQEETVKGNQFVPTGTIIPADTDDHSKQVQLEKPDQVLTRESDSSSSETERTPIKERPKSLSHEQEDSESSLSKNSSSNSLRVSQDFVDGGNKKQVPAPPPRRRSGHSRSSSLDLQKLFNKGGNAAPSQNIAEYTKEAQENFANFDDFNKFENTTVSHSNENIARFGHRRTASLDSTHAVYVEPKPQPAAVEKIEAKDNSSLRLEAPASLPRPVPRKKPASPPPSLLSKQKKDDQGDSGSDGMTEKEKKLSKEPIHFVVKPLTRQEQLHAKIRDLKAKNTRLSRINNELQQELKEMMETRVGLESSLEQLKPFAK